MSGDGEAARDYTQPHQSPISFNRKPEACAYSGGAHASGLRLNDYGLPCQHAMTRTTNTMQPTTTAPIAATSTAALLMSSAVPMC